MIIKNLTCDVQKLVVKEISGEHREYDMFFRPQCTVDLDRMLTVIHPEKYEGIFAFEGCPVPTPHQEVPQPEVSTTVVEEEKVDTVSPVEEKIPDSFVCDVCGAEFASARGLTNHKNKAHAE